MMTDPLFDTQCCNFVCLSAKLTAVFVAFVVDTDDFFPLTFRFQNTLEAVWITFTLS